ncbi:protein-L-isoaspartate(D-aspartate) O-methyltransferase [Persicimonas caeni]|uniref:Protein-L-isoaspartate O-methyltransferase n=1 Tax=Persicimonas caeni TaxID=2292766 RepID=A0A4Y6PWU1_PERCE|nr:ATPase, T2SS/T4P/T4SS family [Persicimonas caeni]QDG52798.1 protein-L-isoaspartate(D-aspartate) O-methyltransferase [Persicimonas caeni]QED34020.1 protein-L-isoaspartate(D-aspartate) O-methyltransferase [Persicimonas caeni]
MSSSDSRPERRLQASVPLRKALQQVPRQTFALDVSEQQVSGHGAFSGTSDEQLVSLVRAARLTPDDRVLEIGTGIGYRAALVSRLVSEVHTIDSVKFLADHARQKLDALGFDNVHTHFGDGLAGLAAEAPFDAILVMVPGVGVPAKLLSQLADSGRLVALVGTDTTRRKLLRVTREGDEFPEEMLGVGTDAIQLGDIVVEMGLADRERVEQGARKAAASGQRLGEELIEEGVIDEVALYRALAVQRGMKFETAQILLRRIDRELYRAVSQAYLEHSHVLPIRRDGARLQVATTDPAGNFGGLAVALGASEVDTYLVTPRDFRRIWAALRLGKAASPEPDAVDEATQQESRDRDLFADNAFDARMVAIFEAMLLDAVAERASDIHLEVYDEEVRVRFRIDGELHDIDHYALSKLELRGLINILKINAGLDIAERRLPQGGRFRRRAGETSFDLRVQTQPSLYGEHGIMRILPQDQHVLTIEELGFPPKIASQYRRLLDSPGGLILVVGPTGSGKSTTLYAGLQVLAKDASRKVITVEDPIEYSMHGIQQTQVKPEIGFAFHNAMRAFVREDPDVILVGEIRDKETALEAVRASQTGHLVLSTLHSNDAVDAVQRLFDLDMHANSIASELLAVIAQRLAKRICKACREPAEPEPEILAELFPHGDVPADFQAYRGAGCSVCGGRGTRGRIAVLEFLRADKSVRAGVTRRLPVDELRQIALDAGMITMRDSALWLVNEGMVPLAELPRVLPAERMAPEK